MAARRRIALPWRRALAALVALGLVALGVMLYQPGGSPAAAPAGASAAPSAFAGEGRGRTSATALPVALASPTRVPLPTSSISVPGAAASGAGTGTGFAPGSGPLAPNTTRFVFTVRDAKTKIVLPGVCVTYGADCVPDKSYTDWRGMWAVDFPRGDSPLAPQWLFTFTKTGYAVQSEQETYTTDGRVDVEILLVRTP